MFYMVMYSYLPNMAQTIREMGYIRALSELGIQTRVVVFEPDNRHSRVETDYPHVTFNYLWDKYYIGIPRIKKLFLRYYMRCFVRDLQPNDTVYVYGFPELVVALSKRNDIRVFAERTECDEASFVCNVKKTTLTAFHEACKRISGVIVISQSLKEYYIQKGCKANCVHVVNMIVDTTRFNGLQKQPSKKYIAYCGTASNNKDGVDQLIHAFSVVVRQHSDYKLYIIGSTPSKQQRFDNYELVKELGIVDNVVFTGTVKASDMPQLLKNAAILALDRPDNIQAKYGFPTKLGEYLLTGNPVVITRVGDIPLFLKNGETALIAEPNNPNQFAKLLCWAIEHPVEAAVIGKNGQCVAEEKFNYLTETKKLVKILNYN